MVGCALSIAVCCVLVFVSFARLCYRLFLIDVCCSRFVVLCCLVCVFVFLQCVCRALCVCVLFVV